MLKGKKDINELLILSHNERGLFLFRTTCKEASETPFCMSRSWRALSLQPYILHNEDKEPTYMDSPHVLGTASKEVNSCCMFDTSSEGKVKVSHRKGKKFALCINLTENDHFNTLHAHLYLILYFSNLQTIYKEICHTFFGVVT